MKPGQIEETVTHNQTIRAHKNLQLGHNFLLRADTSGSMILQVQLYIKDSTICMTQRAERQDNFSSGWYSLLPQQGLTYFSQRYAAPRTCLFIGRKGKERNLNANIQLPLRLESSWIRLCTVLLLPTHHRRNMLWTHPVPRSRFAAAVVLSLLDVYLTCFRGFHQSPVLS